MKLINIISFICVINLLFTLVKNVTFESKTKSQSQLRMEKYRSLLEDYQVFEKKAEDLKKSKNKLKN